MLFGKYIFKGFQNSANKENPLFGKNASPFLPENDSFEDQNEDDDDFFNSDVRREKKQV